MPYKLKGLSLVQTNSFKIFILLWILLFSTQCYSKPIEVFVSILPQRFLVDQIGGDQVSVNVMVKPGQSPETFEPSPRLMSLYSKSDVYFTIGLPFEQVWIDRVASLNNSVSIVKTQVSAEKMMNTSNGNDDDHGHHHELDPHTWLSSTLFLQQAKIVLQYLKQQRPERKSYFELNYNRLESEVNVINGHNQQMFKNNNKHTFITFHPAFSYFAQQYGLTQLSIEVDGKEPSARQIAKIINLIQDKDIKYLLIEKQFNQVIPKTIAHSIDAELLIIDPLALDYLVNMRDIADKINRSLF